MVAIYTAVIQFQLVFTYDEQHCDPYNHPGTTATVAAYALVRDFGRIHTVLL